MEPVTSKLFEAPFVSHDAGVLAGAVVLRPATSVDRLVPIAGEPSPIAERAIEQHGILVGTLRDRGVQVTVLEATAGTPCEAFVGDTAILIAQGAILARPSVVERRAEVGSVQTALEGLGAPNAGSGLRARSNALGRSQLAALAAAHGLRMVEVPCAPTVRRLRNVLSFVGRDTVVVAPERLDVGALSGLQLIELPLGEEYAAGVLALGERRVIANLRFRESLARLRKAKITVEAIDMWEFGKAGAGPFSLVLATKRR
jgi:dimethylargininase